jgi:hypothetical protein
MDQTLHLLADSCFAEQMPAAHLIAWWALMESFWGLLEAFYSVNPLAQS